MLERDLDPKIRSHMINGADDFTGFADHSYDASEKPVINFWGLATSFVAFIAMADKNNMSMKASKTFFDSLDAEFWGHILDKNGHRAAIHHLEPIRNMVAPLMSQN